MMWSDRGRWRWSATALLYVTVAGLTIATAREVADRDISQAIDAEIFSDSVVLANAINVATLDGVVTLTGTTPNILDKQRIQELAEATVGVRAVVNQIEVVPGVDRTDEELARAVEAAWLADAAADAYELSVAARDGTVTLSGTVQSYAERGIAEDVAKSVKGVQAVENNIQIDFTLERTDDEIRNEVVKRLRNDVRVDDFRVRVEVTDGEVTLTGTVGSLQEKKQASYRAWVAGVKSVDTDDLDIEWWARDTMRRKTDFVRRSDEEIRDAVKDAFLYDPRVQSYNPMVEVSYGVVTLSGVVDNLEAKRAAEQDARNTVGVLRVKNRLQVRGEIPTDEELRVRVSEAFVEDPYVERFELEINAFGGWVYLSGDVNSSFEKERAKRVAEGVKGVIGVSNLIDYEHEWVWKPDWEVKEDIQDQLFWSPFVSADEITVSVINGVATLEGKVHSWSERDAATKNAYQGGAKDVKNYLLVDYQFYGPYGPNYFGSPFFYGPYYYPTVGAAI